MKKLALIFNYVKDTKNTYRYEEEAKGDAAVGQLYVQKAVLGSDPPKSLHVTIDEKD